MVDILGVVEVSWVLLLAVLLAIAMVAWFFYSKHSWKKDKTYLPGHDVCLAAHDRFHLSKKDEAELTESEKEAKRRRFWHVMASRLIYRAPVAPVSVPDLPTVNGLVSTMMWVPMVGLNVLLLANVLGTIVPPGPPVDTWLGAFGRVALATAILYAVSQTVCGLSAFSHSGEEEKRVRWWWGPFFAFVLASAILVEGGLAVYRATLIHGGRTVGGPNVFDRTLASQFGMGLGFFMGVFFPIVHTLLGHIGYPQFLRPMLQLIPRICGAIVLYGIAVLNYVLVAWHPVHPKDYPDWVKSNSTVTPAMQQWADRQQQLIADAQNLSGTMTLLLQDLPEAPVQATALLTEGSALAARWREIATEAKAALARASELAPAAIQAAEGTRNASPRLDPLYELARSHDRLDHLSRVELVKLKEELVLGGKRGEAVQNQAAACLRQLGNLRRRLADIATVGLHGTTPKGLISHCRTELGGLERVFAAVPPPEAEEPRYSDYRNLERLLYRCKAQFEQLETTLESAAPVIPSAATLEAQQVALRPVTELENDWIAADGELQAAMEAALERLRRVERRPGWFYWLADVFA